MIFGWRAGLSDQPGSALRFEQVDCGNIDFEAQAVTSFGAVHRIGDAAHELVGAGVEVEEGLRTHGLHIFNRGLELIGLKAAGLEEAGAILRAHAESDVFARMSTQALSVCEGETNGTSGLFKDLGIPLRAECAF